MRLAVIAALLVAAGMAQAQDAVDAPVDPDSLRRVPEFYALIASHNECERHHVVLVPLYPPGISERGKRYVTPPLSPDYAGGWEACVAVRQQWEAAQALIAAASEHDRALLLARDRAASDADTAAAQGRIAAPDPQNTVVAPSPNP